MLKKFQIATLTVLLSSATAFSQTTYTESGRTPNQRCTGNPTHPHWVTVQGDNYQVAEGRVVESKVNYEDYPPDHASHDWNVEVALDDNYNRLSSPANGQDSGKWLIEMEWETKSYPREFWPIIGDRVWMLGRWVFDCGHRPYRTELHPLIASAVTRDAPAIFTGDVAPSVTKKTYVYINGDGGYYKDSTVTNRDYEFDIDVGSKPSPGATLRAEIIATPYGGPTPSLTLFPGEKRVHVSYPLSTVKSASPGQKFGAIILAGWREQTLSKGYRELRVTLDNVRINNNHALISREDWHMWVQIGDQWVEVLRTKRTPGLPPPAVENGLVGRGQTVPLGMSVTVIVPEDRTLTLRTTGWASGHIDDYFGRRLHPPDVDQNDPIGVVEASFLGSDRPTFGAGKAYDIKSTGINSTEGDFNLRFHIEEVKSYPVGTAISK